MTTEAPATPTADPDAEGNGRPDTSHRVLGRAAAVMAPLAGLALVLVLAALTTPGFFSGGVLRLVLFQAGLIGVTAVGQTLVLLVGGIDLSLGAVMGLTTVIVASYSGGQDARLAMALLISLAAGAVVGLVNGLLVVRRQVPAFVATFATFVLVQGVITAWTRGAPSGNIPAALSPVGTGRLLGVPVPTWIFLAVAAVAAVVLGRTGLGRRIYATGANARATALSGVRTGLVVGGAFVASALLGVVAGVINAGYIGYVDAQLSRSLDLNSVAAAVIGGIALTGGRGRIGQTVAGVALLAVLLSWLRQLGAGPGAQLAVSGAVILLAVWLQNSGGTVRFARRTIKKEGVR
jgi:ribose/xylose/arabinose/galactoside ABC-type transport system permease subunit